MGEEWTGWVREAGGPWRVACRAATEGECWRLLLPLRTDSPNCEKLVNRGRHPDHRRKPR